MYIQIDGLKMNNNNGKKVLVSGSGYSGAGHGANSHRHSAHKNSSSDRKLNNSNNVSLRQIIKT